MTWLQILQLSMTLMAQALAAFDQGAKKEHEAAVVLPPKDHAIAQQLVQVPKS